MYLPMSFQLVSKDYNALIVHINLALVYFIVALIIIAYVMTPSTTNTNIFIVT